MMAGPTAARSPMHIAFVTSLVPDARPMSGFAIANRAVVDGLRSLGHRVSIVGAALPDAPEPDDPDTHVLARLAVENVDASALRKLGWLGGAVRHGLPFAAAKLLALDAAPRTVEALDPDLLVLNSYQMAAAFPALRERPHIYFSHNVEHETARENARVASGIERHLYARDARILERLERDLVAHASHVWTLTEEDRAGLGVSGNASVLPLVVPRRETAPHAAIDFDTVMIGTWTWTANRLGLLWYLDEVVPHLPADTRVAVAGSVPGGLPEAHRHVTFLGRVDDAEAFLDRGHVVPLVARGGTGVQLKTIEAFQNGRETVATRSSLRGVGCPPPNCAVADEPEAFAAALAEAVRRGRAGEGRTADGEAFRHAQLERLRAGLTAGLERALPRETVAA